MAEEYTVNFNLVQDAARTAALQTAGGQVAGAGAGVVNLRKFCSASLID